MWFQFDIVRLIGMVTIIKVIGLFLHSCVCLLRSILLVTIVKVMGIFSQTCVRLLHLIMNGNTVSHVRPKSPSLGWPTAR